MDPAAILAYLAFGLFGGIIGGLLGVGGSIGFIPVATVFLAPDKQQLQGAAMIANLLVALTAYRRYRRADALEWRTAARVVPAALVAVLGGVAASVWLDAQGFRVAFAAFLALVGIREFRLLVLRRPDHPHGEVRELSLPHATAIGAVMGSLSGLLGIGGGVIGVPLFRTWARLPVKRAVVASVCTMLPLCLVGAATKAATLWNTPLEGSGTALGPTLAIAACLAPTAMVGSWLGASANLRLAGGWVRLVLAAYLPVAAVAMAWPVVAGWIAAHR